MLNLSVCQIQLLYGHVILFYLLKDGHGPFESTQILRPFEFEESGRVDGHLATLVPDTLLSVSCG
jgi:hypothetical protein